VVSDVDTTINQHDNCDAAENDFPERYFHSFIPSLTEFKKNEQFKISYQIYKHGRFGVPLNTVMNRLTKEIFSEKCIVRRFRRCANVIECT
jgi:hypothetical protein